MLETTTEEESSPIVAVNGVATAEEIGVATAEEIGVATAEEIGVATGEEIKIEEEEESSPIVAVDGVATEEEIKIEEEENRGRRKRERELPPEDDCCPICFELFTLACRGECGHWYYCANCILEFWQHATRDIAIKKFCECPLCKRPLKKLSLDPRLHQNLEPVVVDIRRQIQEYNSLFVGGLRAILRVVIGMAIGLRRMVIGVRGILQQVADPNLLYFHEVRILAILLGIIYSTTNLQFVPTGGFRILSVFDCFSILLLLSLRLVAMYWRWLHGV